MSHVTCPKCGSEEHITGYGLAMGQMGAYTVCEGCDLLLEFMPDFEGVPEDRVAAIQAEVDKWRKEVWGSSDRQLPACTCGPGGGEHEDTCAYLVEIRRRATVRIGPYQGAARRG